MTPRVALQDPMTVLNGAVNDALMCCRLDGPPVILSSLPELDSGANAFPGSAFINGPPGRNISFAVGLRAALPNSPLILIMNADSVTLGTNHLIHAARRNIGMSLLLLRRELTAEGHHAAADRTGWAMPDLQASVEARGTPLQWISALEASFVGRGSLDDPEHLADVVLQAINAPGFSIVGVIAGGNLDTGVLSRSEWPEYFSAYRDWMAPFIEARRSRPKLEFTPPLCSHHVPRFEIRLSGLGGHGIKLAGTALSEAAGLNEGLAATQVGEYGSATRGGPSTVDIVFGSDPITYPGADNADILVALTQHAADEFAAGLSPRSLIITDSAAVRTPPQDAISLPIVARARETVGQPVAAGIVSLGCVAAAIRTISVDSFKKSIENKLPARSLQQNLAAFSAGYEMTIAALAG